MFTYKIFGKREQISPTYVLVERSLAGPKTKWRPHNKDSKEPLHYSNKGSKIATFAKTKTKITGKVFLAKLLKDREYIPKTIVVNKSEFKSSKIGSGKWYLKPDDSFGGKGIKIVNSDLLKELRIDDKLYVLQESVKDLVLYEGHKFDLRIWVYLIYSKGGLINVYLHRKGGYLRIAKPLYDETSTAAATNLTNNSFQDRLKSVPGFYVNQLYHVQPFYDKTFSQIENIITDVFKRLRPYWQRPTQSGFEIMGVDFLVTQSDFEVKLLELNRHLGYPIINGPDYNPAVRDNALSVTSDMIQTFIEPMLLNKKPIEHSEWIKLLSI